MAAAGQQWTFKDVTPPHLRQNQQTPDGPRVVYNLVNAYAADYAAMAAATEGPSIHQMAATFVANIAPRIYAADALGYAWESWLQVEMGMHFAQNSRSFGKENTPLVVLREQPIYVKENGIPDRLVDLWIKGSNTRPNVGVELKVKGKADFVNEFLDDWTNKADLSRVQGVDPTHRVNSISPGTHLWGIGITTSEDDVKRVKIELSGRASEAIGLSLLKYYSDLVYSDSGGRTLYVVSWCQKY
jgi:hypothetical protein